MSKSSSHGISLKSKQVRAAMLTDKTVLFADALDRTRFVAPLEKDDGKMDRVRCAIFFARSKKNKATNNESVKEYAGTVLLPAALFGNEKYGFYLPKEPEERVEENLQLASQRYRGKRNYNIDLDPNDRDFS